MNGGMYDSFLIDNVWNMIPCSDLLALANAAITTKGTGGGCGGIGGGTGGGCGGRNGGDSEVNVQRDGIKYLFDLNSPPIVTEPELITGQLTPVTPKPTTRSDIINSNTDKQDDERFNFDESEDDISIQLEENEDFEDGLNEDFDFKKTPQQPKQRRRKHRPKVVIETKTKSAKTTTGKRKIEATNPTTVRQIRNSCKRKINFEDEIVMQNRQETKKKTQVELVYDQVTVHKTQASGPITPNKLEQSRGLKRGCYNEDGFNSLEAYLSMITSSIYKKKRTEKCQNSVKLKAVCSAWSPEDNNGSFSAIKASGNKHMLAFVCLRKKRSKSVKRVRDLGSFAGLMEGKQWPSAHKETCMEALAADLSVGISIATKKRTKRNSFIPSSFYHNHWFIKNRTGFHPSLRWKSAYDVNALINQFESLGIDEQDHHALIPYLTRYQEKNALVLYQQERSVVPFEGSSRRRKPRPKVDLDDETSRVWRLLLEDINSQGIDGTDEDMEKWWEDERNVFRGRATSFIARMHLVQGDRRFSQWKGSVVDSVIGVFLTQNVSDHLSSSAFMSLAARYPLKSKSINELLQDDKSNMSVKKPCQLDLEETMRWHEENSNKQPVQDQVSIILQDDNSYEEKVVNSNEISHGSVRLKDILGDEVLEVSRNNLATSAAHDSGILASFTEERSIKHKKHEEKCASEQSGISAEISEVTKSNNIECGNLETTTSGINETTTDVKKMKTRKKQIKVDWDSLRTNAQVNHKRQRTPNTMDSLDYEAVRCADVNEIADTIKDRGMNNMLAERIKDFLNRLVRDHGSVDLEWLRDVPPDKAKEYLLSFRGLGLKSVECVRLLTLHHLAFPVDTNVGRIAVRLGWVPLQPLPESLQLHLLELYPVLESIQKYLWPRLCKLDQRTLYELHYQMITFGKVFCTKSKPNCNACPMRGECRHFASAFASARLALPAPEEKSIVSAIENKIPGQSATGITIQRHLALPAANHYLQQHSEVPNRNPVIEEPATPEPVVEVPATPEPEKIQDSDIEDFCEDPEEIPTIRLNFEVFTQNLQTYMENNMELAEGDMSRALVALTSEAASIPTPKLKNVSQLRTEHQVYELPDSHPLLEELDKREPDDPCPYLLAIWTPGETAESIQPPEGQCSSQESGTLCCKETCFFCNSIREANSQTVRGTLLIPCRTAMRGSFPLNGTYFQVNEVFADHDSSLNPIDVPRSWLWNLPRRTVYFGTSIPTIFRGLTTEGIQYCFWRGFVCVRGFDQKTRAPRPLMARLHFPASKLKRSRGKTDETRYGGSRYGQSHA